MQIENDTKLDYSDVLIRPKRSTLTSRKEVDLQRVIYFRNYNPNFDTDEKPVGYRGIPIMAANMDGVGTFEMADTLAAQLIFTCLKKTYSVNELVEYFDRDIDGDQLPEELAVGQRQGYVAMSIGCTNEDYEKFRSVYELTYGGVHFLNVDVANGYTERFSDFIHMLRSTHPELRIIAGNVVTADQTQELIINGADIVKVGIGPGSVCTTRIKTGVGYPQLSAVIECADAAHGLGGHIIADGGCTGPGDVAKAFAGGADFVMLGGMLAGHDEGGGDVITKYYETGEYQKVVDDGYGGEIPTATNFIPTFEEKKFVQFYGMSSEAANEKHFGGLKDYRAAEGKEVLVPYRGSINSTIQDILGGLRSTCTYAGARRIKDLTKCATFVKVNNTHNKVFGNGS
jgi:GMP reductase